MNHRKTLAAAALVGCLVAAGCGSSSKSSSSGSSSNASTAGSTGSGGVAAATQVVQSKQTEPKNIPSLPPLPKAPEKGLKVAFLTCQATACSLLNPGFTAAAQALGWSPTVITYSTAQPGQAVQQAIDSGYKYIATTSITLSEITPQVQEAKSQGIAIFGAYTTDQPGGASNGLYGVAQNGAADAVEGALPADYIISDSKGKADTVFVDLPVYPSLVAVGNGFKAEMAKNCPSCSVDILGLSATQLGAGQVPSAIVSYLQSHPNVNYVMLSFQDLDPGVAGAIRAAGLSSKVKIVGGEGQQAQLKEVQDGTEAAWTVLPEPYVMWVVVDWMARQSEGVLTQQALQATDGSNGSEQFIVTNAKEAAAQLAENGGAWPGPTGYQSEFKQLWHVG
jgi:ribose transport system substrate-binding protein